MIPELIFYPLAMIGLSFGIGFLTHKIFFTKKEKKN